MLTFLFIFGCILGSYLIVTEYLDERYFIRYRGRYKIIYNLFLFLGSYNLIKNLGFVCEMLINISKVEEICDSEYFC